MKRIGVGAVISLAVVLQAGVASAQAAHGRAVQHATHDAQVLGVGGAADKATHAADHAMQQGQQIVQQVEQDAAIIAALTGLPADAVITELEQAAQDDLRKQEKKLEAYAEAHAGEWIAKGASIDGVLQQMSAGVVATQHPRVPEDILNDIRHVVPNDKHFEATIAQVDRKLDQIWTDADKARHLQQQIEGAGAIAGILTGLPISGAIGNLNTIADAELKKVEGAVAQHLGGIGGAIGAAAGVLEGGIVSFDDATRDRNWHGAQHYGTIGTRPVWNANSGEHTFGGGAEYQIPDAGTIQHTVFNGGYEHDIIGFGKQHSFYSYGDPNGLNHASAGYRATGSLGYDAKANGGYLVDSRHIAGEASADVFVGAKAGVQETFDTSICGIDISGTGTVSGNAGAGADIGGHFSIDWSHMSVSVGGNIGATLGLGMDISGDVTVSLGGVFKHPGQAVGCVWDGVKMLGKYALEAGEKLVTAAWDVGKTAVTTLAKGVTSVAKAVGNGIKNVASGIGKALGGLFGHHKKKSSPPAPPKPVAVAPVDVTPWIVPGLGNIDGLGIADLGWTMPETMPTDMPMAAGDEGANVGRDAATTPNDTNGWGYGANAYTMPPASGASTGTTASTQKPNGQSSGGFLAR